MLVPDEHPGLACDELGAQVVRMAAEAEGEAALLQHRLDERSQIGQPAIVPHHEFVELPPGRDVLVLEGLRPAPLYWPQHHSS